jgi:hypothetical protein
MKKELDGFVKSLYLVFMVAGVSKVLLVFLVLAVPDVMAEYAVDFYESAGFVTGSLVMAVFFFLCGAGVHRHNKAAYFASWPALIFVALYFGLLGYVIVVFMAVWLIKSRSLFFAKPVAVRSGP